MFETKLSKEWYNAIDQRRATRVYTAPPNDAELKTLGALARQLSWQNVRIMLLQGSGMRGNIKGTDVYAALISQKGAMPEQIGYAGEALALQATSMGLGCCWLQMYHKKLVDAAAKLKDGETVTALIALGQCTKQQPNPKRKPLSKITELPEGKSIDSLPEWQQEALRSGRLAPSAMNSQPWRFIVEAKGIGVVKGGFSMGGGPLDCGIAMMHIALGAFSKDVTGSWREMENGWLFTRQ